MQLKRWITALVAIPFLLLLLLKGGVLPLTIFLNIVCLIGLWEYYRIAFHSNGGHKNWIVQFLGYLTGSGVIWAAHFGAFEIVFFLLTFFLIVSGFISLYLFKNEPSMPGIAAKGILGVVYVSFLLSYLVLLRKGENGVEWIFFLLILVFIGDTGALYGGTFFGRHKLLPSVSPGKTIEGWAAGLIATLAGGLAFRFFFLEEIALLPSILLFICVAVIGPAGDLFESMLKRAANIKDSGGILPGHGGLLDRIDALLFAAPVAYLFKEYLL